MRTEIWYQPIVRTTAVGFREAHVLAKRMEGVCGQVVHLDDGWTLWSRSYSIDELDAALGGDICVRCLAILLVTKAEVSSVRIAVDQLTATFPPARGTHMV